MHQIDSLAAGAHGIGTRLDVALEFRLCTVGISKGPLKEAYERGRERFETRVGANHFACASCHVALVGHGLRGQVLVSSLAKAALFCNQPMRGTKNLLIAYLEKQIDSCWFCLLPDSSSLKSVSPVVRLHGYLSPARERRAFFLVRPAGRSFGLLFGT